MIGHKNIIFEEVRLMKKILIALVLIASLPVVSACSRSVSTTADVDVSATDVSATDVSVTDVSVSDVDTIPAPEGCEGYIVGDLYLYYPDTYTVTVSDSDALSVSVDSSGAFFSVVKTAAVDMTVSELSKTDLDAIGEKSVADLKTALGDAVEAEYTYKSHGTALDGAGVYFAFELKIIYTELEFYQNLSYYQLYIADGNDIYIATFATNITMDEADAETYFADVISSIELQKEIAE